MKAQRDICRNISLKRNRIGDRPSLSFAGPNPLQIACSKGKPLFLRIKLHRREKTSSLPGQKPQTFFTLTRSLQIEFYPSNDSGMTGEASLVKNMDVLGKNPRRRGICFHNTADALDGKTWKPKGASYLGIEKMVQPSA